MPLNEDDEGKVKGRLLAMYMDTIHIFRMLCEGMDMYFGENAGSLK